MNWLRRLLGLHVHEWGDIEVINIPAGIYSSADNPCIAIKFTGRTLHVRWCTLCGEYKNVTRY